MLIYPAKSLIYEMIYYQQKGQSVDLELEILVKLASYLKLDNVSHSFF